MQNNLTVTQLMEWLSEQPRQAQVKFYTCRGVETANLNISGMEAYNTLKIEIEP